MADAPKDAPEAGCILIHNIGLLLTGDLDQPIADSDCLLIEDGVIIGLEQGDADRVIDAGGCAVAPGLIDGHCHPVFGDWTPRQNQSGWIEMNVNGGVTSFISAGEVHLPGRPKDAEGVKALAMVAQRCFANFRSLGAKVIAGAPVPELDFGRDFYEGIKAAGIRHIGEIGDRNDHACWRALHRWVAPRYGRGCARGAAGCAQPYKRRPNVQSPR
jgi:enamidase